MIALYWVRAASGKWHAWPQGGRRTYCGRVNVEHLSLQPLLEINQSAPVDGDAVCLVCAKKVGLVNTPACGDLTTAAWMGVIRLHLTRVHIRNVADSVIEQFATLLAEVGSPDEVAAREVYEDVHQVLLKPTHLPRIKTLPHLKDALSKLPPKTGALLKVANTVRAWRNITGRYLSTENFRAERVIETMLQVPVPEPYIRHLNMRGLPHFAAMFHSNTLERAKKDPTLRGLFGGSNEYWDRTASQLNVVSD